VKDERGNTVSDNVRIANLLNNTFKGVLYKGECHEVPEPKTDPDLAS
jgi:hypothetical protein